MALAHSLNPRTMYEMTSPPTAPLPARDHLETLIADILAEARTQGATAAASAWAKSKPWSITASAVWA